MMSNVKLLGSKPSKLFISTSIEWPITDYRHAYPYKGKVCWLGDDINNLLLHTGNFY